MEYKSEKQWSKYYFECMKLIDTITQSNREVSDEENDRLDFLAEHGDFTVESIAELNNCTGCSTWNDLVLELRNNM